MSFVFIIFKSSEIALASSHEVMITINFRQFIKTVSRFTSQKPDEIIGVHCTHGFNRTGFLIVSYMVEQLDFSLEAALLEFAKKRYLINYSSYWIFSQLFLS